MSFGSSFDGFERLDMEEEGLEDTGSQDVSLDELQAVGGHMRSISQNQLPPHALPPPIQLPSPSVQLRRPRCNPSHPYFSHFSNAHEFQQTVPGSWYEHTNSQIHTLVESQKKLLSIFEKFSDRIQGFIQKNWQGEAK